MKTTELRIKRKTLTAEALIIRLDEQKALRKARERRGILKGKDARDVREAYNVAESERGRKAYDEIRQGMKAQASNRPTDHLYATYEKLRHHRITVVRDAARAAHLAYAYLKGMEYSRVEQPKYDWPAKVAWLANEVAGNVTRFGGARGKADYKDVLAWMGGKQTHWQVAEAKADKVAEPA